MDDGSEEIHSAPEDAHIPTNTKHPNNTNIASMDTAMDGNSVVELLFQRFVDIDAPNNGWVSALMDAMGRKVTRADGVNLTDGMTLVNGSVCKARSMRMNWPVQTV